MYRQSDASEAGIHINKSLFDSWGVELKEQAVDLAITFAQVTLDLAPGGQLKWVDSRD